MLFTFWYNDTKMTCNIYSTLPCHRKPSNFKQDGAIRPWVFSFFFIAAKEVTDCRPLISGQLCTLWDSSVVFSRVAVGAAGLQEQQAVQKAQYHWTVGHVFRGQIEPPWKILEEIEPFSTLSLFQIQMYTSCVINTTCNPRSPLALCPYM